MSRLYCPTELAILLVGVPDSHGVLRFPQSLSAAATGAPGLHLRPKPLMAIDAQLVAQANQALACDVSLKLDLVQDFADEMTLLDATAATLYLGSIAPAAGVTAPVDWPNMPDLLRAMAKNRNRLPYLRAWQVLTGGLSLNTKALDLDEVKKHLLKT